MHKYKKAINAENKIAAVNETLRNVCKFVNYELFHFSEIVARVDYSNKFNRVRTPFRHITKKN